MGAQLACQKKCLNSGESRTVRLELEAPDGSSKAFHYQARETPVGQTWLEEVRRATSAKLPIKDPWRVYNAPGGPSLVDLREQFERCVATINSHSPGYLPTCMLGTEDEPTEDVLQERLNYAHTFFETMMGAADEPAEFWVQGPPALRTAIEHYNLLIHAIEDASRQRLNERLGRCPDVRVVVTFAGRRRVPMHIGELASFGLARNFGVAYLNYCMVGKHLLEACWDEDDITGVLRPQTHLSADTLFWLGNSPTSGELAELEEQLDAWWKREGIETRFQRDDPHSAVGYCPVADLIREEASAFGLDERGVAALVGGAKIKRFRAL